MSKQISVREALGGSAQGQRVCIRGWLRSRRDSKAGISFLAINDGSCLASLQAVVPADLANYESDVLRTSAGCSVIVNGELVASQGKGQAWEIQADSVEVIGWVEDPETYPIAKKRHSHEFLRAMPHLRIRTNTFGAVSRIRTELSQAVHRFFYERGFQWVNTPLVTTSDCEGAGELFRVSTLDLINLPKTSGGSIDFSQDFFGGEAFLTVSGQLNAEAYCLAQSKVYTFGPTFRAENSHTSRHLAEFWMVEPEIAFADLAEDAQLAEDFLRYLSGWMLERCADDLVFFEEFVCAGLLERLRLVADSGFARMTYSEAIEVLQGAGRSFEYPVAWGMDLQTEHERYLCEEYAGRPLVVTDYPKEIKAFYMRQNDDGRTVAAMDVLAPGIGEIIGGSQREDRLDRLEQRMSEQGIGTELDWYRDLRRYGSVPHAGFGLGFERLLIYVTGLGNIRDVIPFPRVPNSALC